MIRSSNAICGMLGGHAPRRLQEQPIGELHDVRLVTGRDGLPPLIRRQVEREPDDAFAPELGDRLDGDAGVGAHLLPAGLGDEPDQLGRRGRPLLELDPRVHVLDVLPDDDEVHGVVVRRHARVEPARTDAREQLELTTQRQVHAPHPARHRCLDRSLQRDARRPDRREGGRRERVADARVDARAHPLVVPFHGDAGRLDRAPGRLDDLRTDPVARDQRDAVRHSITPRRTGRERQLWPSRSRRLS